MSVARTRCIHRAIQDDPAWPRAHHQHAIRQEHSFAQVVGDQDHRRTAGHPQFLQRQPQFLAREHVERAEGLVEHQQRWLMD